VNTFLGAPLVLSGARAILNLQNWLNDSMQQIADTTTAIVTAANRKSELDQKKLNLIRWAVKFNDTMRTDHAGLSYIKNLVPAPKSSSGRGTFTTPLLQTQEIWKGVNDAVTPDLVLTIKTVQPDGSILTETLEQEEFKDMITDMSDKWNEWVMAQQAADNVREKRNDTHALAYACMRDYRAKAQNVLPEGHALLDSLPLLNPDASQNPDAPEGSGVWNGTTEQADLTAVASTSPAVVRHEVRYSPEPVYNVENEIVLMTIPLGEALTYSTDIGLGVPGDKSRFQWVAVTANGHEGRSSVVEVERTT